MDVLVRASTAPITLAERHFASEWGGSTDNAARSEKVLWQGQSMLLSAFDVGGETVHVVSHIGQGKNAHNNPAPA